MAVGKVPPEAWLIWVVMAQLLLPGDGFGVVMFRLALLIAQATDIPEAEPGQSAVATNVGIVAMLIGQFLVQGARFLQQLLAKRIELRLVEQPLRRHLGVEL